MSESENPPDALPDAPAQALAAEEIAPEQALTLSSPADAPAEGETAPASTGPAALGPAAVAALLAQHFPGLFGAGRALPIKLRIQADIQQRVPGVFNRKSLSLFLHRHTTSTAYLRALASAPSRFDLDGVAAGEIADEHRQAAAAEVERRRAIVEARRAAERSAQRQAPGAGGRAQPAGPAGHSAAEREPQDAASIGQPGPTPRGPAPEGRRRPPRPGTDARPPRPPRPAAPGQAARPPRPADGATAVAPQAPPAQRPVPEAPPPDDAARRERALLLRAYDSSTLTRANFCVLKRITEAELESQLTLARQERSQRADTGAGAREPAADTGRSAFKPRR
jgi:sRNA-binding protein